MRRASALLLLFVVGAAGACQGFATSSLGAGLGASCDSDDQCQGAKCVGGVCAIPCDGTKCPTGMVCAAALCQLPVVAGFVYPGEVQQEAFTQSLELGRSNLPEKLPYLTSSFVEDKFLESDVLDAANGFYAQGARMIVGAAPGFGSTLASFAAQHDDAQLLVFGSAVTRSNLTSYDVRTYEGYYLAGIAAGTKTTKNRLGIIGSVFTPSVVASINAFALGAQSVRPDVVVEVRWLGDYHDRGQPVGGKTLERVDTEALLADGADVIAHTLDNNISVAAVAQVGAPGTYAIGGNVRTACDATPGRCIGSVYYNWTPVFAKLIDDYHKQRLQQRLLVGLELSALDSPIDFIVSDAIVGSQLLSQQIDGVRTNLVNDKGVTRIFDGPLHSTGQCEAKTGMADCVAMGQRLSDADLASMCWFVQGIVDKDMNGMDEPAMVPELGDCAPKKN